MAINTQCSTDNMVNAFQLINHFGSLVFGHLACCRFDDDLEMHKLALITVGFSA